MLYLKEYRNFITFNSNFEKHVKTMWERVEELLNSFCIIY